MNEHQILSSVLTLNNIAASLIEKGDFEGATSHLSDALQSCTSVLREGPVSEQVDSTWDYQAVDRCMSQVSPDSDDESRGRRFDGYVYLKPISVPASSVLEKQANYQSKSLVSLAVIFNLAVAHHKEALLIQEMTPMIACAQLRKASRFYQLAYTFQQRARLDSNVLFTLVMVNNAGQIHRALHEEELANNYFRHVNSILMFTIHRPTAEKYPISTAIIEKLLQNSCHLFLLGAPPTASAA